MIWNILVANVAILKDEKIRGRVTIFLSGKMISTGAKSVVESID